MLSLRRFGSADLILLVLVVLVAAGSRVWYLAICADNAQREGPLQVQDARPKELAALVQNLKEQHQFAGPAPLSSGEEITAHTAPGYALFLAGLGLLPMDVSVDQVVRWIQCGLGTLAVICYFLFALRAFGNRWVAALTGLFCALHPFWIINTAEIKDGVLATFLLAVCLFLGIRASQSGGPISSLVYGLALAALALVRAALLPFAIVAVLWFALRCRTVRRGWLCALLAFLGFTIGLSRWIVRDYQAFGDLVPIADSTYLHLWAGNNPRSDGGPQTDATLLEALAQARGEDPKALADQLAHLGQKERYDGLAGDVWKQVQNDPAGIFRGRLAAALDFLFGEEWFQRGVLWKNTGSEETEMPSWLAASYPALLYGTLLGMFALGLLGWRWTFGWRSEAMLSALALVWVPLPYVLSHAEALQGPRLPLDGILLCYAAFVIVYVIPPIGASLWLGPEHPTEKV
jgi:4-amino-4-deoxy-L-arabinose transferase-like glycosyltransferase